MSATKTRTARGVTAPSGKTIGPIEGACINGRTARKYASRAARYADDIGSTTPARDAHRALIAAIADLDDALDALEVFAR